MPHAKRQHGVFDFADLAVLLSAVFDLQSVEDLSKALSTMIQSNSLGLGKTLNLPDLCSLSFTHFRVVDLPLVLLVPRQAPGVQTLTLHAYADPLVVILLKASATQPVALWNQPEYGARSAPAAAGLA